MELYTINYIKSNPYIYNYLRENSFHYKELNRDGSYISKIEELAKEKYKLRFTDKLDRVSSYINLIFSLIDK